MSTTTLLALVQQAAGELGMPVPTIVAASPDDQVKQYLRLINAVGYEVSREFPWQALNKAHLFEVEFTTKTGNTTDGSTTITGVTSGTDVDATYQISGTGINQATYITASAATTLTLSQQATETATGTTFNLCKVKYSLPADYDRTISNTHWDKSKHWQMLGPETPQQWEWLISGYISTGPRIRYRIFGNYFQIWPMLDTAEVLGFEYVSTYWAANSSGTAQGSFTADTDTCIFPDRLMVIGLKRKFWQIKGFDTTALDRDWSMQLDIAKANDGGAPDLSMNPRRAETLISWLNIPDSGYGS